MRKTGAPQENRYPNRGKQHAAGLLLDAFAAHSSLDTGIHLTIFFDLLCGEFFQELNSTLVVWLEYKNQRPTI